MSKIVHDNIHISQLPSSQIRFPSEGSNDELPCLEMSNLKKCERSMEWVSSSKWSFWKRA